MGDYHTAEKLIKKAFSKTGKRPIFFISMYIHVLMVTNRLDQAVDLFIQQHGWPSKNLNDKRQIPFDTFKLLIKKVKLAKREDLEKKLKEVADRLEKSLNVELFRGTLQEMLLEPIGPF